VTVVFISKFDIFGGNLPLYHVDRVVRETGKIVDNGFEEVFPKTSAGKRRYKETESGVNIMCEIMEKLATEARDEGMLKTLFSLVEDGVLTISEAAKRANMTEVIFTEKTKQFKS
jgi:hypothetical protein